MKNKLDKASKAADEVVNQELVHDFKGYTIGELRYQRAVVAMKKELCKEEIFASANKVRNYSLFGKKADSTTSKMSRLGFLGSKLFSGLNYADYLILGVSLFSNGKKVLKLFNRNKK